VVNISAGKPALTVHDGLPRQRLTTGCRQHLVPRSLFIRARPTVSASRPVFSAVPISAYSQPGRGLQAGVRSRATAPSNNLEDDYSLLFFLINRWLLKCRSNHPDLSIYGA